MAIIRKKIKILVVCPKGDINSGGIISSFELLKYLKNNNCDVRVITPWAGTYNTVLTKAGILNKTIEYNWWLPRDTPEDVAHRVVPAIFDIVREIKCFKPDLVLTNTSHIPWGAMAASFTNVPHLWIVREFPINNFEYLKNKTEFIKKYSNKIVANSKELADFYKQKYGYDTTAFMSYVDVSNITLGKSNKTVRLVSPNYMSETKNQIELILAAKILKEKRKDLPFKVLLMGEQEKSYGPKLNKVIKLNGMQDDVTVLNRVDRPWSMISTNDIIVQTSLSESIGRTTTEAMKLAIPIIATNIPGHREAFRLGGGVLYELGNVNDLAEKIEHMLDDEIGRKKHAQNSRKKVFSTMSEDACNGPVLKVIQSLVGHDNPMKTNIHMEPFLNRYIYEQRELQKYIIQKEKDIETFITSIEDIKNSRSYRLGERQIRILNKLARIVRRRTL